MRNNTCSRPLGTTSPSRETSSQGLRNLTVCNRHLRRRAEGGHTLSEFKQIIRAGTDFDHVHPTCTASSPTPTPANCIPPPVDGNLLQVMPWPTFHYMTDHQLDAIYEYLSAIPCLEGSPDRTSILHNDCGPSQAAGQDVHSDWRRTPKL